MIAMTVVIVTITTTIIINITIVIMIITLLLLLLYGDTMETVRDVIFLGSKITAVGDSAMKLKDACSLEEELWPI